MEKYFEFLFCSYVTHLYAIYITITITNTTTLSNYIIKSNSSYTFAKYKYLVFSNSFLKSTFSTKINEVRVWSIACIGLRWVEEDRTFNFLGIYYALKQRNDRFCSCGKLVNGKQNNMKKKENKKNLFKKFDNNQKI